MISIVDHLITKHYIKMCWLITLSCIALGMSVGFISTQLDSIIIIIGIVIAIPFTLLAFFRTEWGLYIHVIITYTSISSVAIKYYGAPSVAKFFVPYLFVIVILRWYFLKDPPVKGWQQTATLFVVYLFVPMLSLLYAQSYDLSANYLGTLVKDVLIAYIIVLLVHNLSQLRTVIWCLLISTIIIGAANTHQAITNNHGDIYGGLAISSGIGQVVGEIEANRVGGPIGASNEFALSLVMILPFAVDRLITERKFTLRLLALVALGLILSTVIFTYSRGALVATAVALATMFLFRSYRFISVGLVIAGIITILLFAPEGYLERTLTLTDLIGNESQAINEVSFSGRTSENKAAIDMFLDNIVLGVGVANYNIHYQDYSERYGLDQRRTDRSAHSLYLEIAAEQGLIGLANFAMLLLFAFTNIYRAIQIFTTLNQQKWINMSISLAISLVAYLTGSLFLHDSFPRYFWLLMGVIFSIRGVAEVHYRDSL